MLDSLTHDNANLINYSKEQDLEICAIKLRTQPKNIILICIYRAPSGNVNNFLDIMDRTLNLLQKPKTEFIFVEILILILWK
jgi:hypothetical protein